MGVMPVACGLCFHGRLWEIVRYCAFSKPLKISQNLSKPLITPSSTRADGMPHSVTIRTISVKKWLVQSAMRYVHRLCFFGMLCRTPGRKHPCFLPSPLFPGFSRASSETLGLSRKVIAPAFTGRLPLAVFPFTRGLLLALRSSSQLLLLGFCS